MKTKYIGSKNMKVDLFLSSGGGVAAGASSLCDLLHAIRQRLVYAVSFTAGSHPRRDCADIAQKKRASEPVAAHHRGTGCSALDSRLQAISAYLKNVAPRCNVPSRRVARRQSNEMPGWDAVTRGN
jgi:hypothetical protein